MKKLIAVISGIFLIVSCASHRKAAVADSTLPSTSNTTSPLVYPDWNIGASVVANTTTDISFDGKSITLDGTLRMRRDDVIQLNLSYNAFITMVQVGTLEFTGDHFLLLNRYNHQYVENSWDELSYLPFGLNFNNIQNVFWGEASDITTNKFSMSYGNFVTLPDGHRLPGVIRFQFNTPQGKDIRLCINFNDWEQHSDWSTRVDVNPAKNTKVNLAQALQILTSL